MLKRVAFRCILILAFGTAAIFLGGGTEAWAYAVDGLALGGKVHFESKVYKEYSCTPSDTFPGYTWCHKEKTERTQRGEIRSSNTIAHSPDGTALYVNRYIEPVFSGAHDVQGELDRLSAKFGEQPREYWMPPRKGLPNALIAVWGKIKLEQLDAAEVSELAAGGKIHKGILVSYLGGIQRSAKAGVPVYRLAGGPGYLWAATFDREGRGALRFLTVDASKLTTQTPQPTPPQPTPSPPPPPYKEEPPSGITVSGTAFYVNSNLLLTNNHVVANCKGPIAVRSPEDMATYPARIYALDETNDLVLLRAKTSNAFASFHTELRVGQSVAAYGFPFAGKLSSKGNFTVGYVTALSGPYEDTRFLQMSTQVQPGNSGGPVFDMSGYVVGVVIARLEGEEFQNVNFAIQAPIVINFLKAKGVAPKLDISNVAPKLTSESVADVAKQFTVQVSCETTSPRTSNARQQSDGRNFMGEHR